MASDRADPALSPAVISFVIAGRTWKLGDPIHSTGVGAVEKRKMVQNFGEAFQTARVEGVEKRRTRSQKSPSSLPSAVGPPADRMSHALVKGTNIGMGNKRYQAPCQLCKNKHATGVCVTCMNSMNTDNPDLFWICSTGFHGRQYYCQHLHEMLRGPH